jgi:hypothetical protein
MVFVNNNKYVSEAVKKMKELFLRKQVVTPSNQGPGSLQTNGMINLLTATAVFPFKMIM